MTMTKSGRKRVTRPSSTVTGRRRICRSTSAAADWTSSVTPIAVAWAYTARRRTTVMPRIDRTSSMRSRGRRTRATGRSTRSTLRRGASRVAGGRVRGGGYRGRQRWGHRPVRSWAECRRWARPPRGRPLARQRVGGTAGCGERGPGVSAGGSAEAECLKDARREQGVADERDDVDEGVGDDERHGPPSAPVVLGEDDAHRDVRQPRADALVQVVGPAQQGAGRDHRGGPPAELLHPLHEVAGGDDLLDERVLQCREDEHRHR